MGEKKNILKKSIRSKFEPNPKYIRQLIQCYCAGSRNDQLLVSKRTTPWFQQPLMAELLSAATASLSKGFLHSPCLQRQCCRVNSE